MGPAVARIQGTSTFRALSRPSGRGRSGPIGVSFVPAVAPAAPRVGYAIGRRHGNAVQRNRLRRRLRACVREAVLVATPPLPKGSYLVSADPTAADLSHPELVRRVGEALTRAGRGGMEPKGPTTATDAWPSSGKGLQ